MKNDYLEYFKKIIKRERLSHLYLLSGERGSGKTKLAFDVAYEILKQGEESSALKETIENRNYPNLFVVEPEKEVIKKEQILLLQNEFNKTSLIDGPRVYIIYAVDRLTTASANSLLKFMEEPQNERTYGFLLTDKKENVISTILSRSQIVDINSDTYENISKELLNHDVNPKYAKIIPLLTKDIEEALKLSEDEDTNTLINLLINFIDAWNKNESILLLLNNQPLFYNNRNSFNYFLNLLVVLFLDIIHVKLHHPLTLDFLHDEITSMSLKLDTDGANSIITEIQNIINQQKYFINIDIAITNLSVNILKAR